MGAEYKDYGFYKVDINYVKYLHTKDSQVFYDNDPNYSRKPYLGLIVNLDNYKYCIPLTSAKERHLNWSNITEHNYVIYEIVNKSELEPNDIYKKIGTTDTYKKLLAVLEIRKMIPITDDLYEFIDFSNVTDLFYKDLLTKEYNFLKPKKTSILDKAETLYKKQMTTNVIGSCYCNFKILEDACKNYSA